MQYLTLEEIKKQLNIDQEFTDDDEFLTLLGESAEDMVSQLIDCDLTELYAENGEMPASIKHAMRMLVDWMYSQQRGSSGEAIEIPQAIFTILKLYRNFR
jgi:uncharacterized phage protein (predicted DNA packaging)